LRDDILPNADIFFTKALLSAGAMHEPPKKTLWVFQGVPGSGKSTRALQMKKYADQHWERTLVICEADSFMTDSNGKYSYDASKIASCHSQALLLAKRAMQNGHHVAVANTCIRRWECKEYVREAAALDYDIQFIRCDGCYPNVHGVPQDKVEQMRKNMETLTIQACMQATAPVTILPPFISIPIPLSELDRAVPFLSAVTLSTSTLIEAKEQRIKQRGPSLHVTILPPRHGLDVQKVDELRALIKRAKPVLSGAGHVSDADGNMAIYLTVDRDSIREIVEWRHAHYTTEPWYPHVTIGFIGKDIHDVPKEACEETATAIADEETAHLFGLILHPMVVCKYVSTATHDMINIQVRCKPGRSDDDVYDTYPELLRMVPRGLVFGKKGDGKWRVWLRAMPKFTGAMGHDDDVLTDRSKDITRLHTRSSFFRLSRKENGAGGAFSCIGGGDGMIYLVCGGTKLVHTMATYDASTNQFQPYGACRWSPNQTRNFKAFEVLLQPCTERRRLMQEMMDSRYTIVTEVMDPDEQHIEAADHLCAVVIGVIGTCTGKHADLALSYGLRTVHVSPARPISELPSVLRRVKRLRIEGYVIIYTDDDGNVLGLEKFKTLWYQILRASRELVKNHLLKKGRAAERHAADVCRLEGRIRSLSNKQALAAAEKELMNKMAMQPYVALAEQIVRERISSWKSSKFTFLKPELDDYDGTMDKCTDLATRFVRWYAQNIARLPTSQDKLFRTFPSVWRAFLDEGHDESFLIEDNDNA
jgi:hypothetical protein